MVTVCVAELNLTEELMEPSGDSGRELILAAKGSSRIVPSIPNLNGVIDGIMW